MFKKDAKTGDKTAARSMNDKCASGTGATIDKCMLKVDAPPEHRDVAPLRRLEAASRRRQVRRVRRDRHRQPRSRAASRRTRSSARSPTRSSCRTCRVLDARQHAAGARAPARRPQHVPAVPAGVLAPAHPADLGRARLRVPEGRARSRSSSSSRRTRSTTPRSAPAIYGLHGERRQSGCFKGMDGLVEYITNGRKARLGETAGPPLVRSDGRSSTSSASSTRSRSSSRAKFEPGQVVAGRHRPRRRLDLVQGGARRRGQATSSPRPTSSRRATRSRTRRSCSRKLRELRRKIRAPTLEVIGFGATGYAADVLEDCVRADVNIVETVAHMMSAVHFFGDVDVICDIGGQDIKVLFMKNGDIANFRLSNSCSRRQRHAAAGDGRSVRPPGHRIRRHRVQGRARAEVQLRLRRLPRHRPRQLPEGGLLRRKSCSPGSPRCCPKNVWQYVVQIPRLAALGTQVTCSRAARSTTSPPSRRRSTTSRSACRAPRCSCTRTPARPARSAPRWRRSASSSARARAASSASMRRSPSNTRRRTTRRPSATSARTSASARSSTRRRPDGSTSRYISGFSCEKGTVESEGGDARARRRAQEDRQAVPQHRRLRVEARVPPLLRRRRRMPEAGSPIERRRGHRRASSAFAAWRSRARSCARSEETLEEAPPVAHRHPARAQHLLDGAVLPDVLRGARHPEAERRLLRRDDAKRCGSRAASTARSTRASRPRSRRRTSTTCSSTTTRRTRRSRSTTSSSRSSRT